MERDETVDYMTTYLTTEPGISFQYIKITSQIRHAMVHTPIRYSIISNLSASDLASFRWAMGLYMTPIEKEKYLNPLRDIPEYYDWFQKRMKHGDRVVLIGNDLADLMQRINDPIQYWSEGKGSKVINIWLAVASFLDLQGWDKSVYRNMHTFELSFIREDKDPLTKELSRLRTHDPRLHDIYEDDFVNRLSSWSPTKSAFVPLPCKHEPGFSLYEGFSQSTIHNENKLKIQQFHGERYLHRLARQPALVANIEDCFAKWGVGRLMNYPVRFRDTTPITSYIDVSKNPFAVMPAVERRRVLEFMDSAMYINCKPGGTTSYFLIEIPLF